MSQVTQMLVKLNESENEKFLACEKELQKRFSSAGIPSDRKPTKADVFRFILDRAAKTLCKE